MLIIQVCSFLWNDLSHQTHSNHSLLTEPENLKLLGLTKDAANLDENRHDICRFLPSGERSRTDFGLLTVDKIGGWPYFIQEAELPKCSQCRENMHAIIQVKILFVVLFLILD